MAKTQKKKQVGKASRTSAVKIRKSTSTRKAASRTAKKAARRTAAKEKPKKAAAKAEVTKKRKLSKVTETAKKATKKTVAPRQKAETAKPAADEPKSSLSIAGRKIVKTCEASAPEPVKEKLPPRKKNLYLRGGTGELRRVVKRKKSTDSSRYYVTNTMLLEEMIKWRDSNKAEEDELRAQGREKEIDYNKRTISEEFGKMIMEIARRVTNHRYFRNYTKEMKEDMMGYAYLKIIKGLKGFNFKYTNVFAYLTTACFNAFRTECSHHYKQVNIKNNITQRYVDRLNVDMPTSSINKSLKTMLDGYDDSGWNDGYGGGYDGYDD